MRPCSAHGDRVQVQEGMSSAKLVASGHDGACIECFRSGKNCARCPFAPNNAYYTNYYSTYYSDYYGKYYADYYAQAARTADRDMYGKAWNNFRLSPQMDTPAMAESFGAPSGEEKPALHRAIAYQALKS